jgi:hypothetical protein
MDLMTKAYNMSHEHDESHTDAPQQRPDLIACIKQGLCTTASTLQ